MSGSPQEPGGPPPGRPDLWQLATGPQAGGWSLPPTSPPQQWGPPPHQWGPPPRQWGPPPASQPTPPRAPAAPTTTAAAAPAPAAPVPAAPTGPATWLPIGTFAPPPQRQRRLLAALLVGALMAVASLTALPPGLGVPTTLTDLVPTWSRSVLEGPGGVTRVVETTTHTGIATFAPFKLELMETAPLAGIDSRRFVHVVETRVAKGGQAVRTHTVQSLTSRGLETLGYLFDDGTVAAFRPGIVEVPAALVSGGGWQGSGLILPTSAAPDDQGKPYSYVGTAQRASGGCWDITVAVTVAGSPAPAERERRCPGQGVVEHEDASGDYTRSDTLPAGAIPALSTEAEPLGFSAGTQLRATPFDTDGRLSISNGTPVLAASDLLSTSSSGDLTALALGAKLDGRWDAFPGGDLASLTRIGGIILVGTTRRTVEAYTTNGLWLWSLPLSDVAYAAPVALSRDTGIVGDLSGRVVAFDLRTGTERWRDELGEPVQARPVVAAGVALFGLANGSYVAFGSDGSQRFSTDLGVPDGIAAGDDHFLVATSDRVLVRLGLDGRQQWRRGLAQTATGVAVIGGADLVGSELGVAAADARDGHTVWRRDCPAPRFGGRDRVAVATSGATVCVIGSDGTVNRLRAPASIDTVSVASTGILAILADGRGVWWQPR